LGSSTKYAALPLYVGTFVVYEAWSAFVKLYGVGGTTFSVIELESTSEASSPFAVRLTVG
jgi:hypothetical protein